MEKERVILERLERIDWLQSEDAPAGALLEEVRSLLSDAEEWVREEPAAAQGAAQAIERSRAALAACESRSEAALALP